MPGPLGLQRVAELQSLDFAALFAAHLITELPSRRSHDVRQPQ